MCDMTFTFGQRGSHFFQTPSNRDHKRLPKKLTALLTSSQIKEVHHVALGYEDSFLLTWRDITDKDHIDTSALPQELNVFLYAQTPQGTFARKIPAIRLTLGPYNNSFIIHDTSTYLWLNLPSRLLHALQNRIQAGKWLDRPRVISLGTDENFVLLTGAGDLVHELSRYKRVESMLTGKAKSGRGFDEVCDLVLHAYRYECYVALEQGGELRWENMPPHEIQSIKSMVEPILRDTRETERRLRRERQAIARTGRARRLEILAALREEESQTFVAQTTGGGLKLTLSFSILAARITEGRRPN